MEYCSHYIAPEVIEGSVLVRLYIQWLPKQVQLADFDVKFGGARPRSPYSQKPSQ